VDKFSHARFEPAGMTKNPEIRFAKSIVDYIFRWLATKFLSQEAQFHVGVNVREPRDDARPKVSDVGADLKVGPLAKEAPAEKKVEAAPRPKSSEFAAMRNQEDAPPCSTCGSIMIRSGSCYKCANCGTTSGCA
jgi:ribonucleoside-diphosphate reductase alpha chain